MITRVAGFLVGVSMCYACGNTESSKTNDSIAGTYVREYSSEVLNELTGVKVGMQTFRDTLYITPWQDGYRIRNAKWRMNDYDNDGWRNMEHGDVRPIPSFDAAFDNGTSALVPKTAGIAPDLITKQDGVLSWRNSKVAYSKI